MKFLTKIWQGFLNIIFPLGIVLLVSTFSVHAATFLFPGGGGTGTSSAPTFGQMLVGNSSGTYTLTATSSLGITSGTTFPFTPTTNFNGQVVNATSTGLWLQGTPFSLLASSTAFLARASTTALSVTSVLTADNNGVQIGRGTGSLSNGANNNVAISDNVSYMTFTGPTGAYSISGFAPAKDGRILVVNFNINQTLTITHDAGSTAGQRITTPTQADMTFAANHLVRAVFVYDQSVGAGVGYWVLYSVTDGNEITSLTGDATATGPGAAALTLATVNSNVGSFTNASITVNGKGLVTAASSGAASGGTVSAGSQGQFGFYNAAGTTIVGSFNGYASSTDQATLFGVGAGGQNATTSGSDAAPTAMGYQALNALIDGVRNTAVGAYALSVATTSSNNTAVGYGALQGAASTTAYAFSVTGQNTAVGRWAAASSTTGSQNTAIGDGAGKRWTIASQNTAVGASTQLGTPGSDTSGTFNTSLGYLSSSLITTGFQNTTLGAVSAQNITTGNDNTCVGYTACQLITTGVGNVTLGSRAGAQITTGYDNIIIGRLPSGAGSNVQTGGGNILIGFDPKVPGGQAAKNQMNIGNLIYAQNMATSSTNFVGFTIPAGQLGVGSTSPYARLSVHAWSTDTIGTLFAVGSSTPTATTTLFGISNTGHIFGTSTTPTLSSCGTGPSSVGSDSHGTVTAGATAGGCTITFASPYSAAPTCVISNQSMSVVNAMTYTVSATALTITETGLGGAKFDYICMGNGNGN